MGFGNLAKMAQQMQADMARVEAELLDLRVEGTAGGGAVKAVVTGKQDLRLGDHRPRCRRPRRRGDAPGPRACRRERGPQPGQGDRGSEAGPRHRRTRDPGPVTTVLRTRP